MSRFISSVLSKEKSLLKSTLETLERASGQTDIDARFTSELIVKSRLKIRQLGLDPEDTTAEELYESLLSLVKLHDQFLCSKLGGSDPSSVAEMLPIITKRAAQIAKTKTIWGIRHSVAKRILKANPPRQLMKHLGYRSLESMLKRESVDNLFAGAYIIESKEWIKKLHSSYHALITSDFESRKVAVSFAANKKWQKLSNIYVSKKKSNVIELKELGSIVVIPMPVERLSGITILVFPLLLHDINEIQLYSSFFKFFQVQNNFGQIVADAISSGLADVCSVAGEDINWKVIHDHFLQLAREGKNENFEPHIQLEDLETDSVEEKLFNIEPALHFWYGSDCLGLPYKNQVVSFNLMDIATDFVNQLSIRDSSKNYFRGSLWDELMKRYLKQEPVSEQVYEQIDSNINSEQEYIDQPQGVVFA